MKQFRVEYEHSGNEHSPDWLMMFIEAKTAVEAINKAKARGAFGYEFQAYELSSTKQKAVKQRKGKSVC